MEKIILFGSINGSRPVPLHPNLLNPPEICSHFRVSDFLQDGGWNLSDLRKWVEPPLVSQILQCQVDPQTPSPDKMIWYPGQAISFSVASAYQSFHKSNIPLDRTAQLIWKLHAPAKLKVHVSRSYLASLPVATLLARFMPIVSPRCLGCDSAAEDHIHLFRDCPLARATWFKFLPQLEPNLYTLFFGLPWKP